MPKQTTKVAKLGNLQKFRDSLAANQANLPHLEGSMSQFETLVTKSHELTARQSALAAEKQDVSKQFADTLTEAERLSTVLRLAVKQHFGIRSEKLTEFDLQPFRGRKKPADAQKQSAKSEKKPLDGAAPLPTKPAL
jgi:hypothetical protein